MTEEPPATSRSLKAVEFVLTETNKVDTARSKTSVSSKKLSESDGEEIVAQEPDVDGNRSITDASSKQSELENLSRTTGGITSALMQMAVGMENVKETKKTKTEEVIPPYFIESVKRSSELDPKTNPFQLTKKRKKELISEYELKVLDTFFVFDNSTPSQK